MAASDDHHSPVAALEHLVEEPASCLVPRLIDVHHFLMSAAALRPVPSPWEVSDLKRWVAMVERAC